MKSQNKNIPPIIATEVGIKLTDKGFTTLEFYFEGTLINCIAIDKQKTAEITEILKKVIVYQEQKDTLEAVAKAKTSKEVKEVKEAGAKLPPIENKPLKTKEKK